jgi:hypothetical protein
MKNHNLTDDFSPKEIVVSKRPVLAHDGKAVEGLHAVQITLNNPKELNSYTSDMVKEVILAVREASNDRAAVAVVLTGAATARFAPAATRASTPRSTPATRVSTASTCASSTTWSRRSCTATSR